MTITNSNEGSLVLQDGPSRGEHWVFGVKFDGCVNVEKFDGGPDHLGDQYIHFCDLDRIIDQLQEVRDRAKLHFGSNWPD